ncbi:MAG TPA: flagellar motor switch phosphatase FliY [Bacillota bacterium]|nr:flagellar motor switch phosphatase FliY [Bacillota bacterium]
MGNEDNMLSQDEIDALLSIPDDEAETDDEDVQEKTVTERVSDYLSSIEADALGEIGNISIGSSATTLSTLLNNKVSITTPTISIIKKPEIYQSFSFEHVNVTVNYVEGFVGQNIFVVQKGDAAIIADIMLGGDGTDPDHDLTEIHLSAVQEVMNQMMGAAATSMSTIFEKKVNISPPSIELKDASDDEMVGEAIDEEVFVKVAFQLQVGDLIDSSIMQLIPFPFAYDLVAELLQISGTQDEPQEEIAKEESPQETTKSSDLSKKEAAAVAEADVEVPLESGKQFMNNSYEEKPAEQQVIGQSFVSNQSDVKKASFSTFEETKLSDHEQRNLDLLLDVPLNVTVELGRTQRPIKDILDLTTGSIIELDKLAGEPVDILVNETLVAKGEVVVIDENFGVRVTDIISKSARIMSLQ